MDDANITTISHQRVSSFPQRKYSNIHGFTLIELIVVIILTSIVAVFSMPRWSSNSTPKAVAENIASDIRYTQTLAMTHGQHFFIKFNQSGSYQISTSSNIAVAPLAPPTTGTTTITLPTGMTFNMLNMNSELISFDGLGMPYADQAGNYPQAQTTKAIIYLRVNNVTRYSIIVWPATGMTEVQYGTATS